MTLGGACGMRTTAAATAAAAAAAMPTRGRCHVEMRSLLVRPLCGGSVTASAAAARPGATGVAAAARAAAPPAAGSGRGPWWTEGRAIRHHFHSTHQRACTRHHTAHIAAPGSFDLRSRCDPIRASGVGHRTARPPMRMASQHVDCRRTRGAGARVGAGRGGALLRGRRPVRLCGVSPSARVPAPTPT